MRRPTCLLFLLLTIAASSLQAKGTDRPSGPRLLPGNVLAYARVDDATEFRELMSKSSVGRMANDPKVKPLMSGVYTGITDLFTGISQQIGISLDELLSIPQGEVSIALVPVDPSEELEKADTNQSKQVDETDVDDESPEAIRQRLNQKRRSQRIRTRMSFGFVAIIESGNRTPIVRRMLETAEDQMFSRGFTRDIDTEQSVDITSLSRANRPGGFTYFIHDETLVIGTSTEAVTDILLRWKDKLDDENLASNSDFVTVMGHCVGAEETRPQITFYLDPYSVMERITSSGGGSGMLMFVVQNLGLEGIKGIGGSSFLAGDAFESITHVHLLLDTRRNGILSVIRPTEGPINPPDWAPADATSFMAINWSVPDTLAAARRLYEKFRGEGAFDTDFLKKASDRTQIDIEKEFIDQLTGRITTLSWMEPPARLRSEVTAIGVRMKDKASATKTLNNAMKSLPNWSSNVHAGVTIHAGPKSNVPERMSEYMRQGRPHVAVVGDDFVYSDSRKLMELIIATQGGGGPGKIKNVTDYDLISGELSGQLAGRPPFMFSFRRPEQSFRVVYELLKNPQMRQGIQQLAESNPVAKMFNQALEDNDLPPLAVFTQYLAPSGAFAYEDTSGLHLASFGLKNE